MKTVNIHASCVAIGHKGVLLLGDSGAGKSDLALRLIDDGARLVCDDRVELYLAHGGLCARAPKSIAGLIEVRGLGLIALPCRKTVRLALAVKLGATAKRLPDVAFYPPPSPLRMAKPVPFIMLDGASPSAPARIRLALAAFAKGLFREDFNPT
ncbi:MAG: HPr kinase/phosphorylase [Rhizomicrobium sp.]